MALFMHRLSAKSFFRLVLISGSLLIIYNEFVLFWFDSFSWPNNLEKCKNSSCTKLLIVADPQLLGYENEPPLIGRLTRWDSDRYLRKSFSYAAEKVKPDAVIFLGDLFDEGSTSSDDDYEKFKIRFNNTFPYGNLHSKMIYIPGDNDIGGEGIDPVTDEKIARFSKAFPAEEETTLNNIKLIPANRIIPSFVFPKTKFEDHQWRIVLSHIPITYIYGQFSSDVMKTLKPHVIFSAHDHTASVGVVGSDFNKFSSQEFSGSEIVQKYLSATETVEIVWPTCSYRMGVTRMAYGAAIIHSDGRMDIAMLWLHSRFTALKLYLLFLIVCLILGISNCKRRNLLRK